jgi:hypothetical protein
MQLGFPPIIIRDKEKSNYYKSFQEFQSNEKQTGMETILCLGLIESLHKRLAYLNGKKIIKLSEYAKSKNMDLKSLLNKAKRQSIEAFREKGVWKIGI